MGWMVEMSGLTYTLKKARRKTMKENDIAEILTSTRTIALVGRVINPIVQAIG
jgi:hypothetical protein